MACKIQIKKNLREEVENLSNRGLSRSLKLAREIEKEVNSLFGYNVVRFYMEGDFLDRNITIPEALVDKYYDKQKSEEEEEARDIQRKDAKRAGIEYSDEDYLFYQIKQNSEDSYKNILFKFLKDNGFDIRYDELKNYDDLFQFERGIDMITKQVFLPNKDVLPEKEAIILAVSMLRDTDNFHDLRRNIKKWDKYEELKKKHVADLKSAKTGSIHFRDINRVADQYVIYDFVSNYLNKETEDSLFKTIKDIIFKLLHDLKLLKHSFYKAEQAAQKIAKDIIEDKISSQFEIPENYELTAEAHWDESFNELRTIARNLGMVETGSSVLRTYGDIYRGEDKIENDLDVILPYEDFLKLVDMDDKIFQGMIKKMSEEEYLEFVEKEIKNILGDKFELDNAFVGPEHKGNRTATLTYYYGDKKIDIFVRTSFIFKNEFEDHHRIIQDNLTNKLQMARLKDIVDYRFFVPRKKVDLIRRSPAVQVFKRAEEIEMGNEKYRDSKVIAEKKRRVLEFLDKVKGLKEFEADLYYNSKEEILVKKNEELLKKIQEKTNLSGRYLKDRIQLMIDLLPSKYSKGVRLRDVYSWLSPQALREGIIYDLNLLDIQVDRALDAHLVRWAKKYNIQISGIQELADSQNMSLLGAADVINKIIYLAKAKDRNITTLPEEVATMMLFMIGKGYSDGPKLVRDGLRQIKNYPKYSEIYQEYAELDRYKHMENGKLVPWDEKINYEILSKAIAERVVIKHKARQDTKNDLFKVINDIIDWFVKIFKNEKYLNLDVIVDELAEDLLRDESKFIPTKPEKYGLTTYKETLNKNPLLREVLEKTEHLKGIPTGSLSYRNQMDTYRKEDEKIHDLDLILEHGNFDSIEHAIAEYKKALPGMFIPQFIDPINTKIEKEKIWETENAHNATGYYGGKLLGKLVSHGGTLEVVTSINGKEVPHKVRDTVTGEVYIETGRKKNGEVYHEGILLDLFYYKEPKKFIVDDQGLAHYLYSFNEKLKYARPKDALDLVLANNFRNVDPIYDLENQFVFYQTKTDQEETEERINDLRNSILEDVEVHMPSKHYEKLVHFQKAFPHVKNLVDYNMTQRAVVLGRNTNEYKNLVAEGVLYDGQIAIKYNPNKLENDTVIHEFAHLFIDLLITSGKKEEVIEAIDRLRNTKLWGEVSSKYPNLEDSDNLDKYTLGKEVLATAIGLDGTELYDNDNILIKIINSIVEFINNLLGITTAKILAKKLVDSSNEVMDLGAPFNTYEHRAPKTQGEVVNFINNIHDSLSLDEGEDNYLRTDGRGVVHVLPRMSNYLKQLFPNLFLFDKEHAAIKQVMKINRIDNLNDLSSAEQDVIKAQAESLMERWDSWRDTGTSIHSLFENLINYSGNITNSLISDWMKNEELYPGMFSFSEHESSLNEMRELANKLKEYRDDGATILTERRFYGVLNGQVVSGTLDVVVVKSDGKIVTFDFKTFGKQPEDRYNKFLFPKHVAQLEAYNQLMRNQGLVVEDSFIIPVERTLKDGKITGLSVKEFKDIKTLSVLPVIKNGEVTREGFTYESIKNIISGENIHPGTNISKLKDHIILNIQHINRKLEILFEQAGERGDIPTQMNLEFQLDSNKDLLEKLRQNEIGSAIISFLELANRRLKGFNKSINNIYVVDPVSPKTKSDIHRELIQTKNQMQVYLDMIQEIQALDKVNFDDSSYNQIQENLQVAFSNYHSTLNKINNFIMKEGADALAAYSGIAEGFYRRKYTDEFIQNNRIETPSGKVDIMKVLIKAPLTIMQQLVRIVGQPIVKLVTLGKGHLDFNIYDYIPGLKEDSTKFYYNGNIVSRDEHRSHLNKYVQKKMLENEAEIESVGRQVALEYLTNGAAPGVSTYSLISKFTDPRGQNEYRIRAIIAMADAIKIANNERVLNYSKRMQASVSKLGLGNISDASIFKDFMDDNGYLITKYSSDFYEEYSSVPVSDREEWLNKNTTEVVTVDSFGEEYIRLLPTDKYLNPKYNSIKDNELYQLFIEMQEEIHKASVGSPSPLKKTFLTLKSKKLHEDASFYELPSVRRGLIDKIEDEGLKGKDIVTFTKNMFRFRPDDMMIYNEREREEKEKRKILSEERLRKAKTPEERRRIIDLIRMQDHRLSKSRFKNKKHYRGNIGETKKEHLLNLNRNIAKSLLLDYKDALDFQMTRSLESTVDVLDETLEIRLYEGEEVGTMVKNVSGRLMKKDWSETNIPEAFWNAVSQHVYREPVGEDAPNAAVFKASEKFRKYARNVAMGVNYISQSMQWMMGVQDIKMEAISGGIYNEENYNNAIKWYNNDTKSIIGDMGRNDMQSITNLLMEKFRLKDFEFNFTDDRILWKMAGHAKNVLRWGEDYANHIAYGTLMYMILDTYKAVNENSEYIDTAGNVTDKPVSIYYFIEKVVDVNRGGEIKTILLQDKKDSDKIVKNTYIRFSDKVKGTNRANFNKINFQDITGKTIETDHFSHKIDREIRHNQRYIFGNYELYNKSAIGKRWYGPFIMMYKNWIEPALRRRFAGGKYALIHGQEDLSRDPLAASQIFYDESLERIPEGYQITLFRWLLRKMMHQETLSKLVLFKYFDKFKVGEKSDLEWENLQPYERENIKRAMFDYSLIMSAKIMYILLSGLFAGDDTEDNEFFYYVLALLKRVSKERGSIAITPWAPHEAMFILRNPVAGINTYDDFYKAVDYTFAFEDNDFYKTSNSRYGIREGDAKLWRHLNKMIPGWRMLGRKNQDYLRALETNKF